MLLLKKFTFSVVLVILINQIKASSLSEMKQVLEIPTDYDNCSTDVCDEYSSKICSQIASTSNYTVHKLGNDKYPGCHCCWHTNASSELIQQLESQAKAYWKTHYQFPVISNFTCKDFDCDSSFGIVCNIAASEGNHSMNMIKMMVNPFDGNHCRCCNSSTLAVEQLNTLWTNAQTVADGRKSTSSTSSV